MPFTQIDRQPDRQRLVVLGAQKSSSEKSPLGLTAPLFVHYNGACALAFSWVLYE